MAAADHLQAPRQHGLFTHHGIDLGDGSVAHYLEGREILRSPRTEFSRGQPISVVAYPEDGCSPVGVTLRRALGRVGEQRYNLLFNNCEHFAHWCKTGRHRSAQVEDWIQTGSRGPGAVVEALRRSGLSATGLIAAVRQLLQDHLSDAQWERGRELGLQALSQLEGLRRRLQERLDRELEQAESRWISARGPAGGAEWNAVRQAAQRIADQLAEVDDLEARLTRRLRSGSAEDRPL
ncbi:MAG: lecithin retinol acyltransferase family protein [Cyanobacteriota bacterium]|nr:lecithin retinol acyltransferase family protein [Cyanobacteriota bacterium]